MASVQHQRILERHLHDFVTTNDREEDMPMNRKRASKAGYHPKGRIEALLPSCWKSRPGNNTDPPPRNRIVYTLDRTPTVTMVAIQSRAAFLPIKNRERIVCYGNSNRRCRRPSVIMHRPGDVSNQDRPSRIPGIALSGKKSGMIVSN